MLLIHRSERAGPLVAALGEVLGHPSGDPFAPELVAVPSRGVERWLAQQLSHVLGTAGGDGVCANVLFPSSNRLLDDAVAAADSGYAEGVEAWSPERVVWPLMKIIDESAAKAAWASVLAVHLGVGGTDRGRRFAVASRLARHFASYSDARPAMLKAWRDGKDEQGDATPLPDDLTWQVQLWRLLRDVLGPSPAELLDSACDAIRSHPEQIYLPRRFSIFGATRISPSRVAVLQALAERREIHLWLNHPSPALWDATKLARVRSTRRRDDRANEWVRNPLLVSMSRDIRELQQLLPDAASDSHYDIAARPDTVLGRLQAELAQDVTPGRPTQAAQDDRSLTVHACHGRARQVEVVREAVLGLLANDHTLEPRDILIMCPDVEAFAPLVAASFGMTDERGGHPAARLRVRLADRSLRQTNPLLSLLSQILELAANRVTATQVLDLAGDQAVRTRFAFTDDDIEQLRGWATAANARWGLDANHRAPYGLGAIAQDTWRSALDRILLGVAMEESDQWIGTVLPLDDVDSGDIELAGRFAELLDRVDNGVRALEQRRTVPQWAALLGELVLNLGEPDQAWQAAQLRGELADIAEAAGDTDVELTRADITALLAGRLAGLPTRANFRTGTLTVCTLVPMRSVPHRVVCLVGMDDGSFPRHGLVDGDDVLARDPRIGERDVRSEDRQLFLDAICAAQEHLVITYTGADPRSGAEVPPCVPLGELLDAVDASAEAPDGGRGRNHVVVRQPLQPFDVRNFVAGELGVDTPFSFDPSGLAGARAASGERHAVPPLVPTPLDATTDNAVDLDDLVRFIQRPARAFLRQRLGISTYDEDDEPADALPVELNGLKKWAIGDRVLRNRLAGMTAETCVDLEWRRGELPPGPLGQATLRDVGANTDVLLAACLLERATVPRSVDVAITLAGGRTLSGTVGGVRGTTVLKVGYGGLSGRQRLAAWVRHLAVVASLDDGGLQSVSVGLTRGRASRKLIRGINPVTARLVLANLVWLRDAGLREPLPLAPAASEAYAERRYRGDDVIKAVEAARKKWEAGQFGSENAEIEHQLVFGGKVPFDALNSALDDGWPNETTRFGVLARRLWTPLLDAEKAKQP